MQNIQLKIISVLFLLSGVISAGPVTVDNHIKIDQFGYRTNDKKIAVISNPQTGYNSTNTFTPGTSYQVRRWSDDAVIFSGSPSSWNGGATHTQSGDKVWWFDFSSCTTPDSYYVFDVTNNVGSYKFDISDCVYLTTMKQALRTYYYQRCGTPKVAPYAQSGWTDVSCHIGSLQDKDCRLYNNTNSSTSKDLSGGWHDAGDYNKYVNFTFETMLDLMLAYSQNPTIWGDDYNIPESVNGIPDLLDEVKYELDWLLKMQNSDGSELSIVGEANSGSGSPPSSDNSQRVYGPATTSASFSASALFALGAIQYANIGQTAYANTLQTAAIKAWNWAVANPNVTFNNTGLIGAGEQEVSIYERSIRQMAAAVFLFANTGNTTYKTFIDNNYTQMHLIAWGYAYPFESGQQDMLLYYASLSNATVSVATAIKNAYKNSMQSGNTDNLPAYTNQTDAYRAYLSNNNYTWGSNTTKGRQGIMFGNMISYNLDVVNNTNYLNAALGFVNYFHGVNPTAFCYLSNMGNYGAENSINEFYHSWFADGSSLWDRVGTSTYGPAPGYVPGGPNPTYAVDGCCPAGCASLNSLCNTALVTPPLNQPVQKSYKDWNTSWPQNSWTITEPGIYTEASYIRLLSRFVSLSCITTGIDQIAANELSADIYPNPANNSINLNLMNSHGSFTGIYIKDLLGRIVYFRSQINHSPDHTIEIDIHDLTNGIYFAEIENNNKKVIRKFVKE